MTYREVEGDLWPQRDTVCHRVAYQFEGANRAIKLCKKLDLVIQAGGCVGVWPRYLATKFKQVVTFEPSPENFDLLEKNLSLEQHIKAHRGALGQKAGFCSIKENPGNCGDDQTVEGDTIPVFAIDDLGLSPDLIYLDIQGDEYRALLGAEETIKRCDPVIAIEIDNKLSKKGDAEGLLKSWDYKFRDRYSQDSIFTR